MSTQHHLKLAITELEDTKAQDLTVLDLSERTGFTDYFVIATGSSDRHVQALADKVHLKLKKDEKLLPLNFEGYDQGQWVLLDYGDFVVHLFQPEFRDYYNLEEFWQDAKP